MNPTNSSSALVIDASVAVAIAARELNRVTTALSAIQTYSNHGYVSYAPGAIITEVLYALCNKHQRGLITVAEYDQSVIDFETFIATVHPSPKGDQVLIPRIHTLGKGYGCSRSADGAYIALAEQLALLATTVLLTFDQELPKQAARNAPTVNVQVL